MTRVRIPPMLRGDVGGVREVPAEGGNVRELLDDLLGRFPALRHQLVADDELEEGTCDAGSSSHRPWRGGG